MQCKKCGNMLPEGAVYCPNCGTAVLAVEQPKLAYWGERFVAWLIDVVIIGAIVGLLRALFLVAWPGFVCTRGAELDSVHGFRSKQHYLFPVLDVV